MDYSKEKVIASANALQNEERTPKVLGLGKLFKKIYF